MDLMKIAEEAFAGEKKEFPAFQAGDQITVAYRIKEGNKVSAFTASNVSCVPSISISCSTPTISSTPTTKSSSVSDPVSYLDRCKYPTFPTSTPLPCTTS